MYLRKKSKCPKENFQSVKRGEMFKYGISGVRKKNERKVSEKKIKVFWRKKRKRLRFSCGKKLKLFGSLVTPLVGCHVVKHG